ncbi:MAG: SDR family NAD(P)-dependent oxidoreductase [Kiritimatiellae bacterium]|nr:SDR family NAD(P)-dependent oxidoreductase [Kiritimatiellia bacterium]MDD5520287.1 SDR family NAD(P)-dependent oxidoreductase [Kiritimatiellia bacterium]
MHAELNNKVALVTGGGRGIGRSICLMLARSGAKVVAASRSMGDLKSLKNDIRKLGGEIMVVPTDISKEKEIERLFRLVEKKFGRLDILVNNAGMGIYGKLVDFSASDFDKIMAVNLRGTFVCCKHAMRMMIPAKSGYIINISSVVGFKGYPAQSAYAASKHGIMGLTKSLAVEAQEYGIRVSAILPGGVDTKLVRDARPDLKRSELLSPDDVAQTVEYLLSLSERAAVDQIYIRRRNSEPF